MKFSSAILLFRLFALVVVLTCSGCGMMRSLTAMGRPYQEAGEAEPHARVRFVLSKYANSNIGAVPGKSCLDWRANGSGNVLDGAAAGLANSRANADKRLGMPVTPQLGDAVKYTELRVRAGEPLAISFFSQYAEVQRGGSQAIYTCSNQLVVQPEAGLDYQFYPALIGSKCVLQFQSLAVQADGSVQLLPEPMGVAQRCKDEEKEDEQDSDDDDDD
jgi:hypothetical protein